MSPVRVIVRGVLGVLIVLVVLATLQIRRVYEPRVVEPASPDAVVVLAGGRGERLPTAVALAERTEASTLVISRGTSRWDAADDACEEGLDDIEVVCVVAEPDSTKGEAQTIGRLARDRSWQEIALVTSEYHLHRATLWFGRCFGGTVSPVSAGGERTRRRFDHEIRGVLHAYFIDRGC